jgi:hypothetical protein
MRLPNGHLSPEIHLFVHTRLIAPIQNVWWGQLHLRAELGMTLVDPLGSVIYDFQGFDKVDVTRRKSANDPFERDSY